MLILVLSNSSKRNFKCIRCSLLINLIPENIKRPLHAALDREHYLITDKNTDILECILYIWCSFLTLGKPSPYIDHSAART